MGAGERRELLEGLSWARISVVVWEPSRELRPGSRSSPARGRRCAHTCGLWWRWICLWMLSPSSLVFRGRHQQGLWWQRGGSPEGIRALQAPLVLRGIGMYPQAPAGTAPASSRTVPGSELLCCVCALGVLYQTGEGMGLCLLFGENVLP